MKLLKTAEEKKRESMIEVKEETIKAKNELDRELKERRNEQARSERRIQQKEENIDKKTEAIERREQSLAQREDNLNKKREEVEKLSAQRLQELERISGLSSDQAKELILQTVEEEVKHETAMKIKEAEIQGKGRSR